MDHDARRAGKEALTRLDKVIADGSDASHDDVQAAVTCVVAFRNALIAGHRAGWVDQGRLDRANALVSLAYGAEFPLTGFHRHRFEQTREGLGALLRET